MKSTEQEFEWNELKDIWINSSQTRNIHIRMSDFLEEVKGKISDFEKDAINSDLATLKTQWTGFKGQVSQFEKDSVKRDLDIITGLLKRFLNLFKNKKG